MGRHRKSKILCQSQSESTNESDTTTTGTIISARPRQLYDIQRNAANDRERSRMRVLSKAFVKLKTTLPWVPNDTKLSKLDTLRLACSYITYLWRIIQEDDEQQKKENQIAIDFNKKNDDQQIIAELNFCWPYTEPIGLNDYSMKNLN